MSMEFVTLEDVQVLQATELALLCRVGAREVWVPVKYMGIADSVVRTRGDRGLLVIPTWLLTELGLENCVRSAHERAG